MTMRRSLISAAFCLATTAAFASPIRLGTWNIRLATMDKWEKNPRFPKWKARMPHVTGLIEEKGFDLMGLQEVCSQQADFIRRTFPDWGLVGVATNDTERGDTGHANGIFFRKDRFRVQDWGWFAISETPDVPGSKSWNTMCVRSCTWAKMEDMKDRREFFFFNTHFDHRSQEAREKGMALILAEIRARNKKNLRNAADGTVPHGQLLALRAAGEGGREGGQPHRPHLPYARHVRNEPRDVRRLLRRQLLSIRPLPAEGRDRVHVGHRQFVPTMCACLLTFAVRFGFCYNTRR